MEENEIRQGPAGGPQPQQHSQPFGHYARQSPYAAPNPLFQPAQAVQTMEPPKPRKGRRVALVVSGTALAAALVGGISGAAVTSFDSNGSATASTSAVGTATGQQVANSTAGTDVSAVAAKVLPSVVQVNVETGQGEAIGSGVVLSADGRILTNAHVVDGARQVTITLSDGTKYQATVLGADTKADIAVLQASGASGLTPATLGDSSAVKVGQEVVAIGSPGGLQNTVTSGIVSATDRKLSDVGQQNQQSSPGQVSERTGSGPSYTAIQTDAAINQGNSGGALVNAAGEVIGINSSIYSPSGGSVGIGFAIPINDAKTIMNQITGS